MRNIVNRHARQIDCDPIGELRGFVAKQEILIAEIFLLARQRVGTRRLERLTPEICLAKIWSRRHAVTCSVGAANSNGASHFSWAQTGRFRSRGCLNFVRLHLGQANWSRNALNSAMRVFPSPTIGRASWRE